MNLRPQASRTRTRRPRKKLFLNEFQLLGFELEVRLLHGLSVPERNAFWVAFLKDAIEHNHLRYGGLESGFVEGAGRKSVTAADRQAVADWLHARADVATVEAGPLIDAIYGVGDTAGSEDGLFVMRPKRKIEAGWTKRRR